MPISPLWGLTGAGLGTALAGQFWFRPEELPADFWRRYYAPGRIQARLAPIRQLAQQQLARQQAGIAERWGGRGLLSGAGARAERVAAEQATANLLAQALANIEAQEMERATQLGLMDWQRRYQEALARRAALGQLGAALMGAGLTPLAQRWGMEHMEPILTRIWASALAQPGTRADYPMVGRLTDPLIEALLQYLIGQGSLEQLLGPRPAPLMFPAPEPQA